MRIEQQTEDPLHPLMVHTKDEPHTFLSQQPPDFVLANDPILPQANLASFTRDPAMDKRESR
jgi:hypothetical protein